MMTTATSAVQMTRKNQGEIIQNETERFRCLLTAGQTAGGFSLFEITVLPGGNAPIHRHIDEDETFFIIEGKIAAFVDGKRMELSAGDTVHFPPGVAHAFRVIGDQPARAMLLLHPGGTEAFYRRMCELVRNRADMELFNEISLEHGIEVLGPCPP
jgi:quercetin dioxygenase-like cupin family protein